MEVNEDAQAIIVSCMPGNHAYMFAMRLLLQQQSDNVGQARGQGSAVRERLVEEPPTTIRRQHRCMIGWWARRRRRSLFLSRTVVQHSWVSST